MDGNDAAAARPPRRLKSRNVTAVLAILCGAFGVHRFYLGQWRGLVYLLFCWTLIPGIAAFVEGIMLLFGSQQRWDEKYNGGVPTGGSSLVTAAVTVVALVAALLAVGVLPAIFIPAYADYVARAQVSEGLKLAADPRAAVTASLVAKGMPPADREAAGLPADSAGPFVSSVAIDHGRIDITWGGQSMKSIAGRVLSLTPYIVEHEGALEVVWRCGYGDVPAPQAREVAPYQPGDMKPRYLPSMCRGPV